MISRSTTTKFAYVRCIVVFSLVSWASGFAQSLEYYVPERHFQFQFYTGIEAFSNDDAHYAITTGGDLDYSTVGTRIVIDQKATRHVPTLGLRFGMQEIRERSNFIHNVYLDMLTDAFVGPLYMAKIGIGYEPEFRRSESRLGAFIGMCVGISHVWGTIGEVGSFEEDFFFETPPGDLYPVGSTISMRSNVLPYASVSLGARYYFSRYANVFAVAGYQFSHAADIWHYRITNPEEEDMSYDFPDSPFSRSPSAIDQDGTYFRIGISVIAADE